MTIKTRILATLGVLALASCATRDPLPFPEATDCFYPACIINVAVVEEGGVRKLKMRNDGNVRMGTRHRLTAIVWNIETPGYEFRGNSIGPPSAGKNAAVGSVSDPGSMGRRRGTPFSRTAAAEFEVPKSMARMSGRMAAAHDWERVRYRILPGAARYARAQGGRRPPAKAARTADGRR